MAASNYISTVQGMYLAYYGRFADQVGLTYWSTQLDAVNGNLNAIVNAFGTSAESTALYGKMTPMQVINSIYNTVFGHDADQTGAVYYATMLANGTATGADIAKRIIDGASGSDLAALNNKIAAATALTNSVNPITYDGAAAVTAARAVMSTVNATQATPTTDFTAALAAVTAPTATTTALTATIAETVNGTAGNDTFNANASTLNAGDNIVGGAGSDTLNVRADADHTYSGFTMSGVERVEVTADTGSTQILDMSGTTGATTLASVNSTGNVGFAQVTAVPTSIEVNTVTAGGSLAVTIQDAALAGAADSTTLNLINNYNAGIGTISIGNVAANVGLETLNVVTSQAASTVATLNVNSNNINISGNQNLTVTNALNAPVHNVDASALNAKLNLNMSAVNAGDVSFKGAVGDTNITFGTAANTKTITMQNGNDKVIAGEGNNTVTLGAGADTVTSGAGNDTITSTGAGNDNVNAGNGNNTVTLADGDDTIVTGTGNDTVTSGAGNDSITDASGDNDIKAGDGNDTVVINGTGTNNIDLGAGNDSVTMAAKELSVADTVAGGTGYDKFVLTNTSNSAMDGMVTLSETQNVSGIEEFDLTNSNINLSLTNALFNSATNNAIVVDTTKATGTSTLNMLAVTAPDHAVTFTGGAAQDIVIVNDAFFNGKSKLNFGDVAPVVTPATTTTTVATPNTTTSITVSNSSTGTTTTTTTSSTTLVNNPTDILRVDGGATIREADMNLITGLERIELVSTQNNAQQTWVVELTPNFSGTIYVSPDVAAGSIVYIDDAKLVGTKNQVVVMRNSNVSVLNANGTAFANDANVTVRTQLDFTSNGDNLVGTANKDIFHATSLNTMNPSDVADGLDDNDELQLGFAVYQGNAVELDNQLDNAKFASIETLTFGDTSGGVNSGVQFQYTASLANTASFTTFNLSAHNDNITIVNDSIVGRTVNAGNGNDIVNVANTGSVSVFGGDGNDTVNGDAANNTISIDSVETANLGAGNDSLTMLSAFAVTVDGGAGNDTVTGSAGNDTITAANVETINAGAGNDTITVSTATAVNAGDGNDTVTGSAGNDIIDGGAGDDVINSGNGNDIVTGGTGNDTITTGTGNNYVQGGAGDDIINAGAGVNTIHFEGQVADIANTALNGTHTVAADNGIDTINNFKAAGTGTQDILDFNAFLGSVSGIEVLNGTAGTTANNVKIVYNLSSLSDLTFSTANIADNGKAVILYTNDPDGDNVASVAVAYVQDVDMGTGQVWQIDKVATVNFSSLTGLVTGSLNNNIAMTAVSAAAATGTTGVIGGGTGTGGTGTGGTGTGGTGTGGTGTGGTTTATVNIAATGASTDGGSTVNTTYNIAPGSYTYTITGFGPGDKFVPFAGAAVSVVPDSNDTDGIQSIQFADAGSGTTATITLVGLTGAQDAGLFNQGSINTVFGAGTI
jgi:hypothetical protein